MNDDPRTEPLKEWNRLARENTENAIVSSMFEAGSKSSEPIEQFSTWLLVGTAAIASFFIANSDKLIPLICKTVAIWGQMKNYYRSAAMLAGWQIHAIQFAFSSLLRFWPVGRTLVRQHNTHHDHCSAAIFA